MSKKCKECGMSFEGRSDKKFCSNYCRSSYHNLQNKSSNNYVRSTNHALRKNRRILEKLNPSGRNKISRSVLIRNGFDFEYCTNIYHTRSGNTFYFCYEQGYLILDHDWIALIKRYDYRNLI